VTAGLSALVGLPLHLVAYAAVVLFFAYLVRGIAGFGSGLIAVPLLSLTFPVTSVVPVVVALDYVGSFGQGARNLDRIAWKEQFALVPFMVIGIGLGLFALRTVPAGILGKVLGGFVVVYAIYQMLPLPPLRAAAWVAVVCGVLGGLVGTLFGTGGPFYAIYLNLRSLEKTAFRATFAANFMIDGGIRLVAYILLGLLSQHTLVVLLAALPVAAGALYLGGHIHTGVSQRAFVRLISVLLLGSGAALLLWR
jgi:uncharacterized membrane protein YfcA